MYDFPVEELNV